MGDFSLGERSASVHVPTTWDESQHVVKDVLPSADADSVSLRSCVALGIEAVCDTAPPCAETCAPASIHVASTCEAPVRKVEV